MNTLKVSEEFVRGKNQIGHVDSDFTKAFGDHSFELRPMPTFQKLGKNMTDAQIESELKPGFCTVGDILTFIQNAPTECKDGWANLFYTPSFVVGVLWRSGGGGWCVCAWDRVDCDWHAGYRVFSPATDASSSHGPKPSDPLALEPLERIAIALEKIAENFGAA